MTYDDEKDSSPVSSKFDFAPEEQELLITLRGEIDNLVAHLQDPVVTDLPFSSPGGEQSIGRQLVNLQLERLPQLFKDSEMEVPHLATHTRQMEGNSCQLACASSILTGLGIKTSELEVAKGIGQNGEHATIWPGEVIEYLQGEGLRVERMNSMLDVIQALVEGGKIMLSLKPPRWPIPHAVTVSGLSIDHGDIELYVNDPQYKESAEVVSFRSFVDVVIPYSFDTLSPSFAVFRDVDGVDQKNSG